MNIKKYINIDTVYTRSINIERDSGSSSIVKAYIPTSRALNVLHRVSDTFNQGNTPRSWALIGPYGSGKSSFAVYLSHLLENQDGEAAGYAFDILNKTDKKLCKHYQDHTNGTKGYLPILITGSPEPLGKRFIVGMCDAALKYWHRVGRKPDIIKQLNAAIEQTSVSIHEIIVLLEILQSNVRKTGKGILIIFDEFGKFLEYEARHYGANDIYLLQALSEMALKSQKANLFVFTLMHQGFEEYARGLTKALRNEWEKIQGRFETVPFLETHEQTMHIISKAFTNKLSAHKKSEIKKQCMIISKVLMAENALPGVLEQANAAEFFTKCYPLHPVTTIILPVLCQKMAQNERTLFNYLGSKEHFGFQESLNRIHSTNDWIMPWELYEYFIQNQPGVLTDPITHRRWAEVVSAVERLGDAPLNEIEALKTIGLFNIIGVQAGFKASKAIIELCSKNKQQALSVLKRLLDRSIVQFRKFSNEYRVWQGSDFDLEAAVQEEIGQLGRFNLPETIDEMNGLPPIVAHRHTIEKVALRYFTATFVDIDSYKTLRPKADQQRLIFCITESADEIVQAKKEVIPYFSEYDILSICPNGEHLRQAVVEVKALQRVEQNCPELNSDPIAQKEFKDRLSIAYRLQDKLLSSLIEAPAVSTWFWREKKLKIQSKRDLQRKLSNILDKIYECTPIIKNELINRDKPSAQAAGARNKLIFAMLHHIEKKDLSIEKFPAEKGIYKAFLYATGLHKKNEQGDYELVAPEKDDTYNFYPVWKIIDDFLDDTQKIPKSFAELNKILVNPPYGIKFGVLPLLYLTVFLYNQKELAFYEDGVYTPYITDQHIERFMKRPDFFKVQRLKIQGTQASLFNSYAKVLYKKNAKTDISLLDIARPLAKFINDLDEYTKKTNKLSDTSQKVLKAFALAKSPADLLFSRLPIACAFPAIDSDETNIKKIEGFTDVLMKVIKELKYTYKTMIEEFLGVISKALFPDLKAKLDTNSLRTKIQARYEGLDKFTVDTKDLRPFIEYIIEKKADNKIWLNRLMLFLGNKVPDKWSAVERDNALLKLTDYSKRLINLYVLQSHHIQNRSDFDENYEVILLKTLRFGKKEYDDIVKIDSSQQGYIKNKRVVQELLSKMGSDSSKIALLADMLDEYLSKRDANKIEAKKVVNE